MMYVGTVVMDKQAEHRYMRVQSLTNREMSLQDEYDAIQAMLRKAEKNSDEWDTVPVPK